MVNNQHYSVTQSFLYWFSLNRQVNMTLSVVFLWQRIMIPLKCICHIFSQENCQRHNIMWHDFLWNFRTLDLLHVDSFATMIIFRFLI